MYIIPNYFGVYRADNSSLFYVGADGVIQFASSGFGTAGGLLYSDATGKLSQSAKVTTNAAGDLIFSRSSPGAALQFSDSPRFIVGTGKNYGFSLDGGVTQPIVFDASGIKATSVRGTAVTFANRPGVPVEGMMVSFTDSTTVIWGDTISGSGSNHVLGYYNGSNWTVMGK